MKFVSSICYSFLATLHTHIQTHTYVCTILFYASRLTEILNEALALINLLFFSEILKQSQRINPFFCDTFLACLKNEQFFVLSLIFYNTHLLIKQDVGPFESFCCFGLGSPRKTPKESTPLIVLGP